jgi:uncharacterized phage protein gp47/JayE
MQLPVQTFSTYVEQMAATLQGTSSALIDLTVGSVLRALLEACASVALWLQWMILQVLSVTRAATSAGTDLDSWMADFQFFRLPASFAAGTVTLSRFSVGSQAVVPVGTVVRVQGGTQTFAVTAQPTNPAWNGANGFTIPIGISSIDVPVLCVQTGAIGNVQAGAIDLLATSIPGVDSVINALPTVGGMDPESDAAFRSRFTLYINSRSLATDLAVQNELASLQQGLRYNILENQTFNGTYQIGNFAIILDDGTGSPSPTLLSNAVTAVNTVRPIGSTYSVNPPVITSASINMAIETSDAYTLQAVSNNIQTEILAWIASLPIGGTLAVSKLEAIAHATDPSVVSVTSTTINGATMDLTALPNSIISPLSVVVA